MLSEPFVGVFLAIWGGRLLAAADGSVVQSARTDTVTVTVREPPRPTTLGAWLWATAGSLDTVSFEWCGAEPPEEEEHQP